MGAGSSVEVPGGGTEGYHVLRVSKYHSKIHLKEENKQSFRNGRLNL